MDMRYHTHLLRLCDDYYLCFLYGSNKYIMHSNQASGLEKEFAADRLYWIVLGWTGY